MSGGVLTQPCETCGGPHFTRDHADAVAAERRYESADLPAEYPPGPDQDRPDSWYETGPDDGYEFRSDGSPT